MQPCRTFDLGFEAPVDPEEQLATRAAWLYFIAENTQAQIGKKLGLTRVRVNGSWPMPGGLGLCKSTSPGGWPRPSSLKTR